MTLNGLNRQIICILTTKKLNQSNLNEMRTDLRWIRHLWSEIYIFGVSKVTKSSSKCIRIRPKIKLSMDLKKFDEISGGMRWISHLGLSYWGFVGFIYDKNVSKHLIFVFLTVFRPNCMFK